MPIQEMTDEKYEDFVKAVKLGNEDKVKKVLGYDENYIATYNLNLLSALKKSFDMSLKKSQHEDAVKAFNKTQELIVTDLRDGYVHEWHEVLKHMYDTHNNLSDFTIGGKASMKKEEAGKLYTTNLQAYKLKSENYQRKLGKISWMSDEQLSSRSSVSPVSTPSGSKNTTPRGPRGR